MINKRQVSSHGGDLKIQDGVSSRVVCLAERHLVILLVKALAYWWELPGKGEHTESIIVVIVWSLW